MGLREAARAAADAVRASPAAARWFLAADNDADGLCAAAVAATALRRAGHLFQVRADRGKDLGAYQEILEVDAGGLIFLDKGTSHVAHLAQHVRRSGRPVLVLDHHNLPDEVPDEVVLVNPRREGMDGGRDACSSTVAAAFALELGGRDNLDLAPVALAGAVGDWQHEGGWRGWNLELLEAAEGEGHLVRERVPRLIGVTLADAVSRAPVAVPGLSGDVAACQVFLERLGIDAAAEAEDLDREARTRLVSAMVLAVLESGGDPAGAEGLVGEALWDPLRDCSVRRIFRVADACGRTGHPGTGIAFLMGDREAAAEAEGHFRTYRTALQAALERLRREGTEARRRIQVAWTDDPAFTGMVAGLGVQAVLEDTRLPAVVLARRDDGRVQVSTRATHGQVAAGLDLGAAVSRAAQQVQAEGGGHPLAAGSVVPEGRVEAFLEALEEALAGAEGEGGRG